MKQITVFLENRIGRLETVTDILSKNNINIICISLSDTVDYGMLRMLVSQPAEAQRVLMEAGFSAMLTDVLAVRLIHQFGMLNKFNGLLASNGIDIKYMYALMSGKDSAVVLKTSDNDKCEELLKDSEEFKVLSAVEIYNL